MSEKVRRAIERLTEQISAGMKPEAIYLFGSQARGDAMDDSDVDLLVIVQDSELPAHQRSQLAREVATEKSVAKDIIVLTRREWEKGMRVPVSLPRQVAREGRLLYGA